MNEAKTVQKIFIFSLLCLICLSLLGACDGSMYAVDLDEPSTLEPGMDEDTVVVSSDDEVLKSPAGDIDLPGAGGSDLEPEPDDSNLERGEVFINHSDILIMESYPPQFDVVITGSLPTPCHTLRVEVEDPDEEDQIHIVLYSMVDPAEICVQVLEPFDTNIQLGTPPPGTYQVILNGDDIGEIGYE